MFDNRSWRDAALHYRADRQDRERRMTDAQMRLLRDLGYRGPARFTRDEASQEIGSRLAAKGRDSGNGGSDQAPEPIQPIMVRVMEEAWGIDRERGGAPR